MSVKHFDIPNVGNVAIFKRKGTRSLKLSITHEGQVRLSMPPWASYRVGFAFIDKHRQWISDHAKPNNGYIAPGSRIGKAHSLNFINSPNLSKPTSRLVGNEIRVLLPSDSSPYSQEAQTAAKKAAIKALRKQAESLLPERVKYLANKFGFTYKSVTIKQLKSRWGSCSEKKDISLSLFLMQLPYELIDYVILHELTHTKVLAHGSKFWKELDSILPGSKDLKKELNKQRPAIVPVAPI
jgi:predicted metal-dependent hydrolase